MSSEIWLPIKGYTKRYHVSNTGKIKSIARFKSGRWQEDLILKGQTSNKGYRIVHLYFARSKAFLVHRLVAEAFKHKGRGCKEVNHLDNNPLNNHADNLEWTTRSGNIMHASRQGRLCKTRTKEWIDKVTKSMKTKKAVKVFKGDKYYGQYISIHEAAAMSGTDYRNVSAVCHGRNKSTGGYRFEFV